MKSLNLTLRTILLALALVSTTNTAFAYHFVVKDIYYNIINGDEASVTYISYTTTYYVGNTQYSLYGVIFTTFETKVFIKWKFMTNITENNLLAVLFSFKNSSAKNLVS